MSDKTEKACNWASKEWKENNAGVVLQDMRSAAPHVVDYREITYPYLRIAVMSLAFGKGVIEREG
jgi:hypothetical protein